MAFKLRKTDMVEICEILKAYLAEGNTIEVFLTDFKYSKKKWDKFVRNNKLVQEAIQDGNVYYKAFWQKRLSSEMDNKRSNSTLAKLAFENSLGLTDAALKAKEKDLPTKRYKVYVDLGPEKSEEELINDYKESQKRKAEEIKKELDT